MATNDLWRRLCCDVAFNETHISEITMESFLNDRVMGGNNALTAQNTYDFFDWAPGSSERTEFDDLVASINTVQPVLGLDVFGAHQPSATNPYWPSPANKARLRAKAIVQLFAGTPQGTLAAA